MRKVGGFVLILVGIALIGLAVMRAFNVVAIFMNQDASAYGFGFIAGTAVMLILLSFFGIKAFKKGKSMLHQQ